MGLILALIILIVCYKIGRLAWHVVMPPLVVLAVIVWLFPKAPDWAISIFTLPVAAYAMFKWEFKTKNIKKR